MLPYIDYSSNIVAIVVVVVVVVCYNEYSNSYAAMQSIIYRQHDCVCMLITKIIYIAGREAIYI